MATTNSKVKKWGNSLAVRLPRSVALAAGMIDGTDVSVTQIGNKLTIESKRSPKLNLEKMLESIIPENVHGETDWGKPVGNEIW